MFNKKTKLILFILFLLFISQPVLAAVELEVEFPKIGGQELTGESTLGQTIKYVFNLAIAGIVLIILFSLVRGGIVYLGSAGAPDKMADARKKIFGSALGLLIVFGSYLLLRTLNPELLILKIEKKPVVSGVLLLNRTAYDRYKPSGTDGVLIDGSEEEIAEALQELLDASNNEARAVYVYGAVDDLREKFGPLLLGGVDRGLVGVDIGLYDERVSHKYPETGKQEFNFKNFELAGLYFLPGTNAKVFTHHNAGFGPDKGVTFTLQSSDEYNNQPPDNEYFSDNCSIGQGPCEFKMLTGDGIKISSGVADYVEKRTAPLAILVKNIGRGVYLYSEKADSEKVGEELYLSANERIEFLRDSPYNFNDKTKRIEIRNSLDEKNDEGNIESIRKTNYLAILHEDEEFKGYLRIFFEGFSTDKATNMGQGLIFTNEPITDFEEDGTEDVFFGKVEKPSSAQVFQMPFTEKEWANWADNSKCKVTLCARKGLQEGCKTFGPYSEAGQNINMPLIEPHTLAFEKVNVTVDANPEDGEPDLGADGKPIMAEESLSNNVRSIAVEGDDCVVVLFEKTPVGLGPLGADWDGGVKHSEVFLRGGYIDTTHENTAYQHNINCNCTWEEGLRRIWGNCDPCVSSIAIFPILTKSNY